ncbi:hypothetical protein Nisw_03025 [Candidatus Nitrosopumilus sp. SW]|uniref:hypothetical protein n=1 Tax=Candidatus Nitrosopumilus sp. SW TaxID=2508726 RepID=UPI001151473F|nr:hypothetical protein [Candidatus Nitrosopumilus sp. SW]QDI88579.1 hypothetical protein Nisw_03025 [Candidatus Nitrosopumilus sp. SW]
MTTNPSSDVMDIINKIKKANIGEPDRIEELEKMVSLNEPLKIEDEEYLIRLLYQLKSETSESKEEFPKIEIDEFNKILTAYKFKLAGSKTCYRCSERLGFKKSTPEKNWGIHGLLCQDCYDHIKFHVVNYSVILKKSDDSITSHNRHGVLSIQNFDNTKRVVFGDDSQPSLISIPVETILRYAIIDFEEESKMKKILTMGFKKTVVTPHFLITYKPPSLYQRDLIISSKELAKISAAVGNLVLEYTSEQLKSKDKDFESYKTT